jgi:hypothetical protein
MPAVTKYGLMVVVACSLALAACGGTKKTATPTAPPDLGRDVMGVFVSAAAAGDAETMWNLLSRPSQRRAGPTLAAFEKKTLPGLRHTLAPFAGGKLPVQVSERLDDRFGIVGLSRGRHAYATPLRHEGAVWRVELPGPLRLDSLRPPPGSRGKFLKQLAVESHGPGGAGFALLYLDGVTLDPKTYSGPKSATVYANFENSLEPGRHTALAFVRTGNDAAARAWTFFP